jgi:hypothetical protein
MLLIATIRLGDLGSLSGLGIAPVRCLLEVFWLLLVLLLYLLSFLLLLSILFLLSPHFLLLRLGTVLTWPLPLFCLFNPVIPCQLFVFSILPAKRYLMYEAIDHVPDPASDVYGAVSDGPADEKDCVSRPGL